MLHYKTYYKVNQQQKIFKEKCFTLWTQRTKSKEKYDESHCVCEPHEEVKTCFVLSDTEVSDHITDWKIFMETVSSRKSLISVLGIFDHHKWNQYISIWVRDVLPSCQHTCHKENLKEYTNEKTEMKYGLLSHNQLY